jgi:hypothetical protein
MFLRITIFVIGVVVTLLASMIAFVLGIAAELGWPLSDANMTDALRMGAFSGVAGGLIVGVLAIAAPAKWRVAAWLIGIGSLLWAAITGLCFFVYVAAVASC